MTPHSKFVEASIVHQLGDLSQNVISHSAAALELALSASSDMSLAWDGAKRSPYQVNEWRPAKAGQPQWQVQHPRHKNTEKVTQTIKSVLKAGGDFDLVVDMQDHRTRNLRTPDGHVTPVLSFVRPIHKNTGHVLWPLPGYHDIDGPDFLGGLDGNRIPWNDKKNMVVWRGIAGNRGQLPKNRKSIRLMPLLRKHKAGEISPEDTIKTLISMPRYRFLHRWIGDPRFDIGYTNFDGFVLADEPLLASFERPKMPRDTFQTYKYIAVLPGNDVGSSFYWTMNSGSVGLVVECEFETFATHHFKPWEHYVPISRDQGNLKRILNWCETNQEECQAIAKRAQEKCKFLADPDLRAQTCNGVISRLRKELVKNNK